MAADMPGARRISGLASRNGVRFAQDRVVPEEVPVALSYGGSTQAVMMATPGDLEDFAVGFSLTEGIVTTAAEINSIDIIAHSGGYDVQVDLADDRAEQLRLRRRTMAGPVGCGLCGIDSIEQALRRVVSVPPSDLVLGAGEVAEAAAGLSTGQMLHAATHAVHGAGLYVPGRGIVALREDVGRHNALDKLCGAMARRGIDGTGAAVAITSRVSVEMVQKVAMSGVPLLIAISAPTLLAIETADEAGITLVAVVRGADFEIFTHARRIAL